jgi:hypothetical protein
VGGLAAWPQDRSDPCVREAEGLDLKAAKERVEVYLAGDPRLKQQLTSANVERAKGGFTVLFIIAASAGSLIAGFACFKPAFPGPYWVFLKKERAGDHEQTVRNECSRSCRWPLSY